MTTIEPVDDADNSKEPSSNSRWRRVWPIAAGSALLLAAAAAGGTYGGWRAAAARDLPTPEPSVVTVAPSVYGDGSTVHMPDVRGLTEADALTALADAGIPRSVVTPRAVPWSGPVGLVVSQSPAFGEDSPASVTLSIAAPAKVPDLVGDTEAAATAALEQLGTRVQVKRVYRPGKAAGTVLSISPVPGKAVPDVVTITVSEAAGAVFLSQVPAADGGCGTGAVVVSGTDHPSSVLCRSGSAEYPQEVAYLLRGRVQEVSGVVGIPDDEDPAGTATVTIALDGKVVRTLQLKYGSPAALSIKAAGALRIDVSVWTDRDQNRSTVALADVELRGDPGTIDRLREDQP